MDARTAQTPATPPSTPLGAAAPAFAGISLSPPAHTRGQPSHAIPRVYPTFSGFLVLFVVCIFAELIANQLPLPVIIDNTPNFPLAKNYPATSIAGDYETAA